ncbi:hypothetical protein ANANG_G00319530, partial [Anguilla anguilla]
ALPSQLWTGRCGWLERVRVRARWRCTTSRPGAEWGSWSFSEASVACRQLGCGSAVQVYSSSPSGTGGTGECLMGFVLRERELTWGTAALHTNSPAAPGNRCPSSVPITGLSGWQTSVASLTCSGEEDDEVPRSKLSCSSAANQRACTSHWPLRLVGVKAGALGCWRCSAGGSWRTVCGDSWDVMDIQVVCRQLGCGSAAKAHTNATFGTENGTLWLTEVNCRGTEVHLWDCPHSVHQHSRCPHQNQAGVTCTVPLSESSSTAGHWPLRLVGGEGGCSGRLEVFHEGSWRKVCGDSWDVMDVQVVCRQLGCGSAAKAHSNATFGTGNGTLWLTEVNCRGTEMHLWDCPHSVHQHSRCPHQNQAGVTCTVPLSESSSTAGTPAMTTKPKSQP